MIEKFSKSERRFVRELAQIAWERQLRDEIEKLKEVFGEMDAGNATPFDVQERIHQFEVGVARDLFKKYSPSDPWFAVCRARYDGVLTEEEFEGASDYVRERCRTMVALIEEHLQS